MNEPTPPLTPRPEAETPETDKLHDAFMADDNAPALDAYCEMVDHARQLERQRDAAHAELNTHVKLQELLGEEFEGLDDATQCVTALRAQRDEALRQRDQAIAERDEAKSKLIAFDNLLKASDGLIATNGAPKALRDALAERDALRQALEDLNRVTRQLLIAGTLPKAQDDAWAEYGKEQAR